MKRVKLEETEVRVIME